KFIQDLGYGEKRVMQRQSNDCHDKRNHERRSCDCYDEQGRTKNWFFVQ
ncbi:20492_t:CDS:1, partial [Racocetra persica]